MFLQRNVDSLSLLLFQLAKLRAEEKSAAERALIVNEEPKTKKLKTYHQGVGKYINSAAM